MQTAVYKFFYNTSNQHLDIKACSTHAKKKQKLIRHNQFFGIGSVVSAILAISTFPASALNTLSYPPFDKRCTESQIRQYLEYLNYPDRIEFVSLALDVCQKEAASTLTNLLQNQDKNIRSLAAYGLAIKGVDEKNSILVLTESLKDRNVAIRLRTAYALGEIGAKETIPALNEALEDQDVAVRHRVALSIVKLGQNSQRLIPVLTSALKDEAPEVRSSAAQALGKMGKEAPIVVSELVAALQDKDPGVRSSVAQALGAIGKDAPIAVPALITALQDKDSEVRFNTVKSLGKFGQAAKPAIPALIATLRESNEDSQDRRSQFRGYEVADTLKKIGKEAVPALIEMLREDNQTVQFTAIEALGDLGKDAKDAVPSLLALLSNENLGDKAAWAVGEIGNAVKEVIPDLIQALKDDNPTVRSHAGYGLEALNKNVKLAIPSLIVLLRDDTKNIRQNAVHILGRIGEASVPSLLVAIQDRKAYVRTGAAQALREVKVWNPNFIPNNFTNDVVPALQAALKDPDQSVRYQAILALQKWKTETQKAILFPKAALMDEDESVRLSAAVQLIGTDPSLTQQIISILIAALSTQTDYELSYLFKEIGKEAVPSLIQALQHPNSEVRSSAASALKEIGKDAQPAVPSLIAALKDKDRYVRFYAAYALAAIGTDTKDTVPALVSSLRDWGEADINEAILSLQRIGKKAVPGLIIALVDRNANVRYGAASALDRIGEEAKAAVLPLSKALKDKESKVRYAAARALAEMGDEPKEVIPSLIEALNDEDEEIRYQVALVLRKVAKYGIPQLLAAIQDEDPLRKKGAAFALGSVKPLPQNAVVSLKTIVDDERQDLDVQRLAASTLEESGLDMQPFFTKNNFIAPKDVVCPELPFNGGMTYYRFDIYTGGCMYAGYSGPLSGGSSLFDTIKRIFTGKK